MNFNPPALDEYLAKASSLKRLDSRVERRNNIKLLNFFDATRFLSRPRVA